MGLFKVGLYSNSKHTEVFAYMYLQCGPVQRSPVPVEAVPDLEVDVSLLDDGPDCVSVLLRHCVHQRGLADLVQ